MASEDLPPFLFCFCEPDELPELSFHFSEPEEQLLLALAIHESLTPRVSAQDLCCWLSGGARHADLDWRWPGEGALSDALRSLRQAGLVSGSPFAAFHRRAPTWALTRKGWEELGKRRLYAVRRGRPSVARRVPRALPVEQRRAA